MSHYQEPTRLIECNDPLDNFADIDGRTRLISKGNLRDKPDLNIPLTVQLSNNDDLATAIESDHYLNKILKKKMSYIQNDAQALKQTFDLVNIYLSAEHLPSQKSETIKHYVLNNLNHL